MQPRFLTGEAALHIGKTLVVADLHVGIEHEFRQAGVKIPSQLERMVDRIERLLRLTRADRFIILGDLKHRVPGMSWQELRELPGFYTRLRIKPELIPGNHDAPLKSIEDIMPEMRIHSSQGLLLDDIYLAHGHTWPGKELLKARWVIVAHSHPWVEFRDRLGHRWAEPVWLKGELLRSRIRKRYGRVGTLPQLIVMPAFNRFAGGVAVNREGKMLGPIAKCANLRSAKAYLLDGTLLGEVKKLVLG